MDFIGWKYTVTKHDAHTHYNKWEENLWKYLGWGNNLEESIDFAGDDNIWIYGEGIHAKLEP